MTKNKKNYQNWLTGLVIVIVISGFAIYRNVATQKDQPTDVVQEEVAGEKVISLIGEKGKNVLQLLQKDHQVEVSESEFGSFVLSINGMENSENAFWFYYVNDKMGDVAADKFKTKDSDKVEWRLESLDQF